MPLPQVSAEHAPPPDGHEKPEFRRQRLLQPFVLFVSPSSQISVPARMPSPHEVAVQAAPGTEQVQPDSTAEQLALQPSGRNLAERCKALNDVVLPAMPDGILLDELAARTGDTPTAITHRLQRNFGFSYSEYVGRLRVEQAKRLMRTTRLSATAVARRVGLSDQSNFTKIFKRHAGMTPLEYRERYGK